MTKYKVPRRFLGSGITVVEVVNETDKFVILPATRYQREHRESKVSAYCDYYDTWKEAHRVFRERAEKQVEIAKNELILAESVLIRAVAATEADARKET